MDRSFDHFLYGSSMDPAQKLDIAARLYRRASAGARIGRRR
jgi:hypothetical protein